MFIALKNHEYETENAMKSGNMKSIFLWKRKFEIAYDEMYAVEKKNTRCLAISSGLDREILNWKVQI